MNDPLLGPRLKVRCAYRELETVLTLDLSFSRQAECRVVRAEYDSDRGKYAYRVLVDILPSPIIGVLIGEIAHNLRSALDGLAWQLALLKTKTPAGNTQFPIFTVGKTKRRRKRRPGKGRPPLIPHFAKEGLNMIRDLRPEHQAAIELLQPYKGGRGFSQHFLYLLSELNNADKHRLLQVVGAHVGAFVYGAAGTALNAPVSLMDAARAMEITSGPLKDGAIVAYGPTAMEMDISLQPLISFADGCAAVKGLPVRNTLRVITDQVSKIIEGFGPEFS